MVSMLGSSSVECGSNPGSAKQNIFIYRQGSNLQKNAIDVKELNKILILKLLRHGKGTGGRGGM